MSLTATESRTDAPGHIDYGPLSPLLGDPSLTEIMVNGPSEVWLERDGHLLRTDLRFENEAALMSLIQRIAAYVGRRISADDPMLDARLPDGSRVNVIVPPLSLSGPILTVRRFRSEAITADELVRLGSISRAALDFLMGCVLSRRNILISGRTGSGKTTLLNLLSAYLPDGERIITIEDAAELQLKQPHWIRLETRPPDLRGGHQVAARDLVRNSLRMRPDRIVVGECRGGEALDMLQAMSTGHDGSMSTIHANSARDALQRLETLCLMAGVDIPHRAIREQIGKAIHVVVHLGRDIDGRRRVENITEIVGREGDVVTTQDAFTDVPHHEATGRVVMKLRPTPTRPLSLDAMTPVRHLLPPELLELYPERRLRP